MRKKFQTKVKKNETHITKADFFIFRESYGIKDILTDWIYMHFKGNYRAIVPEFLNLLFRQRANDQGKYFRNVTDRNFVSSAWQIKI